jgi:hypothetical protein
MLSGSRGWRTNGREHERRNYSEREQNCSASAPSSADIVDNHNGSDSRCSNQKLYGQHCASDVSRLMRTLHKTKANVMMQIEFYEKQITERES